MSPWPQGVTSAHVFQNRTGSAFHQIWSNLLPALPAASESAVAAARRPVADRNKTDSTNVPREQLRMTTAESHHNQGRDELERLGQGLRKYGRLQYVTQENDAKYGGPVLFVFRKHIPESVIAAPGTRSDPEAEPSTTWRVFSRKRSSTPERSTVRLSDIVDNLPGEIADWALTVQRSIIDQALPAGEEQNNLQLELSAAERLTSNCVGCEPSYWPSRAPRYVHVRAGTQDSRQPTGLRAAPVSIAA